MRILCVCAGGAVRSVTLARMLKKNKHETLAVGCLEHSSQTVALLCDWAERIYVAEPYMADLLPAPDRPKVSLVYAVGPDYWNVPAHPGLIDRYLQMFEEWPPPVGDHVSRDPQE